MGSVLIYEAKLELYKLSQKMANLQKTSEVWLAYLEVRELRASLMNNKANEVRKVENNAFIIHG
jgi:hypothetical protein